MTGRSLFFFFLIGLANMSYGQARKESNEEQALQFVRDLYAERIGDQSGIYTGALYTGYPHPIKEGTPFFLMPESNKGEIFYDGMLYKNIPMWYDISRNKLVVGNSGKTFNIMLNSDKVEHFTVLGHHFVNIDSTTALNNKLRQGFYDQIYKGETEFLIRRFKELRIVPDQSGVWSAFSGERTQMYLKKDGVYTAVSSQKSLLDALGNYQKEISQHLKQSKLKYRKNRERTIIAMLTYFDKLNKGA